MMPKTNIISHIGTALLMNLDWKFPLDRPKPTARGTKSVRISKKPANAKYPNMQFPPFLSVARSEYLPKGFDCGL
jgi:hypothetical protein